MGECRRGTPLFCAANGEGGILEYDGLKSIRPFLGGRSDAACRVVIPPSCLTPMGAYGLYHDAARLRGHAALAREGTRYARHLPYRERNSKSRQLIEM